MSVLYHDPFTDSFLFGIGCDIYQIEDFQTRHFTKCGEVTDISADDNLKAEGAAFVAAITTNDQYVAVISNNKLVEIFDRQSKKTASVVATKRPTSVQMTSDKVIIGDKSGDAYSFDMKLTDQNYLLGHVSVIMDMLITRDTKFLITCDRDEKIRVSHFPNCYNVKTYLLGHTEYVLKILLLSDELLLSIGGDQRMILWDLHSSTALQTITSTSGIFTGVTFASPFLITASRNNTTSNNNDVNSGHVTVYKLTDSLISNISELSLSHEVISLAASSKQLAVLTTEPSLLVFTLSEGVLSEKRVVEGEHDLSKLVRGVLPETTKVARTEGFTEYFERKRKRIEEESLKEETKSLQIKS